ncbi:MAG: head-tail adaptor protein [Lentilactobacillus diolivorans]
MAITTTGMLNQRIKILLPQKPEFDEYHDEIKLAPEVIYAELFAMQRNKSADTIEKDLDTLQTTTQFVIRHRQFKEPQITTDMKLVQMLPNEGQAIYDIEAINPDEQYQEFDVLICKAVPEVSDHELDNG